MKTYTFKVVVEPDEGGYHAYCPALRRFGAVTQGATESEALKNINEVVQMIMEELREGNADPQSTPEALADHDAWFSRKAQDSLALLDQTNAEVGGRVEKISRGSDHRDSHA